MQQHHSGMHFFDIQLCIGCSNGTMPVWFSDTVKSAVFKKASISYPSKDSNLIYRKNIDDGF
jgi:hypothetical protein